VFYTAFPEYDPANALFVNGLANELEIQVQFETRNNFIQFDQSALTYTLPADSSATAWWSNSCLQVEYLHTTERRRQDMVKLYGHPDGLRYLFNDFQVWNHFSRIHRLLHATYQTHRVFCVLNTL
jgi:hypothetical protein